MNRFQAALSTKKEFVVTCEHVPGRGFTGKAIDNIMQFAEQAKDDPTIHALSITDNAGGNPAMLADELGTEVLAIGLEPLIHFTCKDTNRNFVEAQAYALERVGIHNGRVNQRHLGRHRVCGLGIDRVIDIRLRARGTDRQQPPVLELLQSRPSGRHDAARLPTDLSSKN